MTLGSGIASVGIDLGSTVAKYCVLDHDGQVVRQGTNTYKSPTQLVDLNSIRNTFADCLSLALAHFNDASGLYIALSSIAPNLILLDKNTGTQICETLLFYDDRAVNIELKLNTLLNNGKWQNEILSKLIWLKEKDKKIGKNKIQIFNHHTYFGWVVTGKYYTDSITASEFGVLYNSNKKDWDWSIIQKFGLEFIEWPPIVSPNSALGKPNNSEFSDICGQDSIILAGTTDTVSSCISARNLNSGDSLVYFGTFNSAARLLIDLDTLLSSSSCQNPFEWWCSIPRSGQQLDGITQLLFPHENKTDRLSKFDSAAGTSPVGANGLIFLHNQDIDGTTVSTNPIANIVGLRPKHTQADLARAVMESFAFILRKGAERNGILYDRSTFYCGGGGSASTTWIQLVSDIIGRDLVCYKETNGAFGAALLALATAKQKRIADFNVSLWGHQNIMKTNSKKHLDYNKFYENYSLKAFSF